MSAQGRLSAEKAEGAQLASEVQHMTQQISSFAAQQMRLESECGGYQCQLEAASSSQQNLLAELSSIKVQLDTAKSQNCELSDHLKAAQKQCSTAAEELSALQTKQDDAIAQAAAASADSHEGMHMLEQAFRSCRIHADSTLLLQQQQQQQLAGSTASTSTEQGTRDPGSIQQQLGATELPSSNMQLQQQLNVLLADTAQLQPQVTELQQQLLLQATDSAINSIAEAAATSNNESSAVEKLQRELQTAQSQLTDRVMEAAQLQSKLAALQSLPEASHDDWVSAALSGRWSSSACCCLAGPVFAREERLQGCGVLQGRLSEYEGEVGTGKNGRVLAYASAQWPTAVFKEGVKEEIELEAKLLSKIQHTNVIRAFGKVDLPGTLIDEQYPAALLALEPLGQSLQALMQTYMAGQHLCFHHWSALA